MNQEEVFRDFYRDKSMIMTEADLLEAQTDDPDEIENVLSNLYSQMGLKMADKILKWPRQPVVDFDHYGGYITVNRAAGRAFYYYFAEAPKKKESLPLLLWLNGGYISCFRLYSQYGG